MLRIKRALSWLWWLCCVLACVALCAAFVGLIVGVWSLTYTHVLALMGVAP